MLKTNTNVCFSVENGLYSYGEYGLWDIRLIGIVTCAFILVIALLSLSLVIKVQLALLFLLILAIFDVLIGSFLSIRGSQRFQQGNKTLTVTKI